MQSDRRRANDKKINERCYFQPKSGIENRLKPEGETEVPLPLSFCSECDNLNQPEFDLKLLYRLVISDLAMNGEWLGVCIYSEV